MKNTSSLRGRPIHFFRLLKAAYGEEMAAILFARNGFSLPVKPIENTVSFPAPPTFTSSSRAA